MSAHLQLLRFSCQICGQDWQTFASAGQSFEHRCGMSPGWFPVDLDISAGGTGEATDG